MFRPYLGMELELAKARAEGLRGGWPAPSSSKAVATLILLGALWVAAIVLGGRILGGTGTTRVPEAPTPEQSWVASGAGTIAR